MREKRDVRITVEGRDKGKVFVINEMPAMTAEKWAYRAWLAMARAGVDVEQFKNTGMMGFAMAGILALPLLDFRDAEPLLDEMMAYIEIKPDPIKNPANVRPLIITSDGQGDDIEEVDTLQLLRKEFLDVHTRFFGTGDRSTGSNSTTTTTSPT